MGVTSFSGSTSSVSFSFKPTATNSNITALKFNSNNQPNFEHTFVAHDNVDKGRVAENFDKFKNFVASASATVVVGLGAVRFGGAKFRERFVDAGANVVGWAGSGFLQFFGNDEAAARVEKIATDFISRDLTGEAKEDFYENTSLGRAINEKSYIKYDSEIANKIQNVSEKATEIGVEVAAATLIPGGGVALSAAIGAVSGMGKSAEKNYQAGNSMKESALDIVINTGTGALEGYSAGAMGSAAINGAKALSNLGIDGAKALAKEKFSSFSGKVALDTLKKNAGTVAKQSIFSTLKDPGFYLDTFGASSNDIIEAAKGETSWLDAGKAIIINTGVSFGTNYLFNYAGGVGSSVFDSANYGHRIDGARDEGIKKYMGDDFKKNNPWLTDEDISQKIKQVDKAAERLYDMDAMDDYSEFYSQWGAERGKRKDPSEYLKPEYIDKHLAKFSEGASRFNTPFEVMRYHANNPSAFAMGLTPDALTSNGIDFDLLNKNFMAGQVVEGSEDIVAEFVTTRASADKLIESIDISNPSEASAKIAAALDLDDSNKFINGCVRYDVDASKATLTMPSGNEQQAYDLIWVPGGYTLNGGLEAASVVGGINNTNAVASKVF